MNYEVWINAREPVSLESVATMRIFSHPDRLVAEKVIEGAQMAYSFEIYSLRCLVPRAIVSVEMRMPQAGMDIQLERLEQAQEALSNIMTKG